MYTRRLFIFLSVFASCICVIAQVTVTAKIDSVWMYVGQQDGIELVVSMPKGEKHQMPGLKPGDLLLPDLEIVSVSKPDTVELNGGKQWQVSQRYIITAWDSSLYYIPPLSVMVGKQKLQSNQLALKVHTIDVDTLHTDVFFPPREIQDVPLCWDDFKGITCGAVLVCLCAGLIGWLFYRIRSGKPIVRLVRRKKKIPAHEVAISQIKHLKDSRQWAQEDSKEYYTSLTDTLRTYIQDRYGFSAMEMTSTEIIERLVADGDEKSLDELREIFRTADLVKFAKWTTQINENDANLYYALQYVNETKLESDPNAKPEPEVVKETDKERLNRVIAMRMIMTLGAVAAIGTLVWIVWRLYDLLA